MMYYPEDVIMDVRSGNDIVDVIGETVRLTRKGANYFGLCPFHGEKTPSFSVNREKQIYHCFGCSRGGNVISFVMERDNLTFPEALRTLADRINYRLPEETQSKEDTRKRALRERLWELHKVAARFYYDCLNSDMGRNAMEYLNRRGLTKATRNKFGLGYSPDSWDSLNKHLLEKGFDRALIAKSGLVSEKNGKYFDKFRNRVMYPIIDVRGHIIAFAGRELVESGHNKYLNSPETEIYKKSFNPYNLNYARLSNENYFLVVEGYMDVISLYQAGFKNAIALCGTAMNDNHTSVIKRYKQEATLLLDSDSSGERAVLKAIPVLQRAGIRPKVLQVKNAKDPDEYIKSFGADAFARLLKTAEDQIVFRIKVLKKRFDMERPDDKIAFTNEVVQILSEIENNIELDVRINETAADTGVSAEALRAETERIKGRNGAVQTSRTTQLGQSVKNVIVNNALEDAKSGLISLIATDKAMYERVKAVLDKKELVDDLYIRLYDIIEGLHAQNRPVQEADVMALLDPEDEKERSRTALIFMGRLPYDSPEKKYNALYDNVKEIKSAYLTAIIENETDDRRVMQLLDEKKNLERFLKSRLK